MTLEQLSWYIDNNVAKKLRGIAASPGCRAKAGSIVRSG